MRRARHRRTVEPEAAGVCDTGGGLSHPPAESVAGFLGIVAKQPWLLALLLVGVTVIAYLPVWHAGIIWDDGSFVFNNRLIRRADGLYRFWFSTQPVDYYPLTSTLWWMEWRLWGANPLGYHVVNVLLHGLSAVVLWRVLSRLKVPGSWLAAAFFAVHPVNVESVAWISERKNTLAMVFYLLGLLSYLRFDPGPRDSSPNADNPRLGVQWRWYWLALVAFVLALLSKTVVAPMPLVLLGLAWWRRGTVEREDIVRIMPFVAAAVAVGLASLWFQSHRAIGSDIVRTDSFWARLAGAGWAVWFYLYKAALPFGLRSIYPRWQIDGAQWWVYLPGLSLVGVFLACARYRRSWGQAPLLALGYFVVMLLPVLGFLNIGFMLVSLVADHWQYFAIIGPLSLAATAITTGSGLLGARRLVPTVALAATLLAVLGGLTWRQCGIYADPGTFWGTALAADSNSWAAHNNLGNFLLEQGKPDAALAHFRKTVEIRPSYATAHYNLGGVLRQQGRVDEAIAEFQRALEIQPNYVMAHYNLGEALRQKGEVDAAIAHFQKALDIQPEYADAHNSLGVSLLEKGQVDEAMVHLQRALEIQPDYAEAHSNLARALNQKGQVDEAMVHLQRALEIQPDHAETHNNLANVLRQKGQVREAVAHYQKALEIQPDYAMAHYNLANLFQQAGQVREAITHYQRALQIRRDFAAAASSLAWVLATSPEASVRNGTRAVELAEQAQRLSGGGNPTFIATLAAAYAEAGRFPEALGAAQRALQLATAQHRSALANRLHAQIALYQTGTPYRDAGPGGN